MSRNMFFVIALLIMMLPQTVFAAYSTVIEDLPLMPGMTEVKDNAVLFDKPGGRIVETAAKSDASIEDVQKFYAEALPPLGWTVASNNTYMRAGEKLTVTVQNHLTQFKITPLQ